MSDTNLFNNKDLEVNALYQKLEDYYENNSLYEDILARQHEKGNPVDVIKGLSTPVNRSVEFFVSKVIPGDLSNINISRGVVAPYL